MVVGLGNCVFTIARALSDNGCDVIAVDLDNDIVDRLAPFVSHAAAGDSTDLETLQRIGASGADVAIVSRGDDISSSILVTMALHDAALARAANVK